MTRGDWHAGDPAWSPDGEEARVCGARRRRTPTCASARRSTSSRGRHRRAGARRARDGVGGTVMWSADGRPLVVGRPASAGRPARLLRVPLDGGDAGRPRRAARPQRHAGRAGYPGGLPQLADDGSTSSSASATAAARTSTRSRRRRRAARCRGGAATSSAASPSPAGLPPRPRDGDVVRRDRRSSTSPRARDRAHRARLERSRSSSSSSARSASSRSPTAPSCTAGSSATRRRHAAPLLLDVHGGPHNAWNGAADDWHLYHQELAARGWAVLLLNPRGSDGYGADFFAGGARCLGRGRREGLPRADRPARRGGHRRSGSARGHRLQLRRLHDLLPDEPGRPLRRGGRRRRRQRPRQHGRHVRPGPLPAALEFGERRGTGDRYDAMSPLARVDAVATPTLVYTAPPTSAARSARRSSGTRHCASEACRPGSSSTRRPTCSSSTGARRTGSTSAAASWTGSSSTPATERPAPIDAGTGSAASPQLAERHGVPGATLGILRLGPGGEDERVAARARAS